MACDAHTPEARTLGERWRPLGIEPALGGEGGTQLGLIRSVLALRTEAGTL